MPVEHNTDLIPTRLRLTGAAAEANAKHLAGKLVGGWGLANAVKIVKTLTAVLRDEKKRRKQLEVRQ